MNPTLSRRALLQAGAVAAIGAAVTQASPVAEAAVAAPVFTNLTEGANQAKARELLRAAGIWSRRVDVLLAHARQFNTSVPARALTHGWVPLSKAPLFDADEVQLAWEAKHPDFPGYNCRLTAHGLMDGLMRFSGSSKADWDLLFMDRLALDADPSVCVTATHREHFGRLYTPVPTTSSKNSLRHADAFTRALRARGISFVGSQAARLVSVVLHDQLDGDHLFVGHTGVLLPRRDGLWFLEKLAFTQPYQLTRFRTREQLLDHLMRLYDTDRTGLTAPTFVMENDRLMAGYRMPRR